VFSRADDQVVLVAERPKIRQLEVLPAHRVSCSEASCDRDAAYGLMFTDGTRICLCRKHALDSPVRPRRVASNAWS
jgi:hypothetical protein